MNQTTDFVDSIDVLREMCRHYRQIYGNTELADMMTAYAITILLNELDEQRRELTAGEYEDRFVAAWRLARAWA